MISRRNFLKVAAAGGAMFVVGRGSDARAMVKEAMVAAGLPIVEEHDSHLVYRNLPLEASDDELISEFKILLRALLPIAIR